MKLLETLQNYPTQRWIKQQIRFTTTRRNNRRIGVKKKWLDTITFDGMKKGYQVTQTKYRFSSKKGEIRLVVKSELLKNRSTYLASIDSE